MYGLGGSRVLFGLLGYLKPPTLIGSPKKVFMIPILKLKLVVLIVMDKERSLSVNSYLLSPPLTPSKPSSIIHSASPSPSPRNLSLPANKLFFFPSNFNSDNPASQSSDYSQSISRKTSGE